jgi:hypothetical protein
MSGDGRQLIRIVPGSGDCPEVIPRVRRQELAKAKVQYMQNSCLRTENNTCKLSPDRKEYL